MKIQVSKAIIKKLILLGLWSMVLTGGFALYGLWSMCAPSAAQEAESNIMLDFKDADIQSVLRILSEKGNVNIVSGKDVVGTVTMRLVDVPWQKALDVILKTYGYGYEREGNIITVAPLDKLTEQKKAEKELSDIQPVISEVFTLKYLDANDAKKVIEPQLSPRGKVTVVEVKGKKGWKFGEGQTGGSNASGGKLIREEKSADARSKTLVVSEIPPYMEKVRDMLQKIDLMPKQIMIETKIVEVNKDKLKDLGIEWGTGSTGAENTAITSVPLSKTKEANTNDRRTAEAAGAHSLGSQITPSVFGPEATTLTAANTGLKILYQKLTGTQFEVILHALEEDVNVNTLSNPRILTLDNQEATILVGTKYPILETNVSGTDSTVTTQSLAYYQDIGIQLNVVPQISGDSYVNMIVHPAISSYTTTVGTNAYPILNIREAETQILMKDGETVVIGGLLKDVKSKGKFSVPILGKIPILGMLFTRDTNDTEKIDLLIFITARIMEPTK
ncbi:MAG: type IV pilus secretin PilQ [Candidatus Omnitrophica bacterium]|nr:type IV pilus secretin PilQ [Candidatus Omnitrophota bacterium]